MISLSDYLIFLLLTLGCRFDISRVLSEGVILLGELSGGRLSLANVVPDEKHVGALAEEHVRGGSLEGRSHLTLLHCCFHLLL